MAAERGREDLMPRTTREEGTPSPASGRPSKGIAIALPPEQEAQVRKLSAKTGLSLRELRTALEASRGVAEAITNELKKRHNAWLETQAKAGDIFAPQEESRG